MKMLYEPGERGQGLVEYAINIATIALIVLVALTAFGLALGFKYQDIADEVELIVKRCCS
jgi:Flp pilus assembly pilin Flp